MMNENNNTNSNYPSSSASNAPPSDGADQYQYQYEEDDIDRREILRQIQAIRQQGNRMSETEYQQNQRQPAREPGGGVPPYTQQQPPVYDDESYVEPEQQPPPHHYNDDNNGRVERQGYGIDDYDNFGNNHQYRTHSKSNNMDREYYGEEDGGDVSYRREREGRGEGMDSLNQALNSQTSYNSRSYDNSHSQRGGGYPNYNTSKHFSSYSSMSRSKNSGGYGNSVRQGINRYSSGNNNYTSSYLETPPNQHHAPGQYQQNFISREFSFREASDYVSPEEKYLERKAAFKRNAFKMFYICFSIFFILGFLFVLESQKLISHSSPFYYTGFSASNGGPVTIENKRTDGGVPENPFGFGEGEEQSLNWYVSPPHRTQGLTSLFSSIFIPEGDSVQMEDKVYTALLNQEGSPQNKAKEWIIHKDPLHLPIPKNEREKERLIQRYALCVLYFSTGGADNESGADGAWDNEYQFLTGIDECSWNEAHGGFFNGVGGCTRQNKRVKMISLWNNNLVGTIPKELSLLKELSILSLYNNNLVGTVPFELSRMESLGKSSKEKKNE